ncbi:MAG: hypothetical protein RLO17_13355 [Cyclobacteriaceae bacterium]
MKLSSQEALAKVDSAVDRGKGARRLHLSEYRKVRTSEYPPRLFFYSISDRSYQDQSNNQCEERIYNAFSAESLAEDSAHPNALPFHAVSLLHPSCSSSFSPEVHILISDF